MSSTRHLAIGASGPTFRTTSRRGRNFAGPICRCFAKAWAQASATSPTPPSTAMPLARSRNAQRYGLSPITAWTARSPPEISATPSSVGLPRFSGVLRALGINKADSRAHHHGPHSRALHRDAGCVPQRQRRFAVVLGLRAGTDRHQVDIGKPRAGDHRAVYQRKIAKIRDRLPSVRHMLHGRPRQIRRPGPERSTSGS